MVETIRHKGLRRFFEDDDRSKLPPDRAERIREILTLLHATRTVEAVDLPGYRLHALKDDLRGYWAVTVRTN